MKLGHIGLPVTDIAKAKTFYDAIASSVGLKQLADHDDFVAEMGSATIFQFLHPINISPRFNSG